MSFDLTRLILSKNEETSKFLLEAEKILFNFHCWCMTEDELYRLLKTFNKLTLKPSSQNLDSLSVALKSLLDLKKQCENSWRILAFRYFNPDDSLFQVPFQTVLPLVYNRSIILKNGIAFIPYSQLPVFLTEIFTLFLDWGIKQARTQDNSDDRLNYISQILLRRCVRFLKRNSRNRRQYTPVIHLDKHSIDNQSTIFPPCMFNLHQTLRDRHRLNHHARSEEINIYQETSNQQDGGELLNSHKHPVLNQIPQLERGFMNNDREKPSRTVDVPQLERRSINIDNVELSETVRYKLVNKEIISTSDHSERRFVNINCHNELKIMSESCQSSPKEIISNNTSSERRFLDIIEDKKWRTTSEQRKLFQSKRKFLNIEGKKESQKGKLLCIEKTVLTNSKQVCVSRNECNIVNQDKSVLTNSLLSADNVGTSDEDQDDFGCDHTDCPSQRDPSLQGQLSPTIIETPLDYCLSYQTLLHKLQQLS
ncbi:hypothetical protein LOTGIDRAFT_175015 [Lottia gigantea]|uniref:Uncharacterized protein n=1 Tax=Lottia gigantea TaxID=225164 RepID=V4AMF5_LOTGI|nr:hypothetical protein LOTGIDRAFT_175015 [Lottia gigantea]ESO95935.1 hypothetical protein LOTGIDRAFT_175015 [Lottia gigantea]